jgi:arginine decarboxylase
LDEYCGDLVETLLTTLNGSGLPHPVIVTESGRPTVAYYSLLLFNIFDVTRFHAAAVPAALPAKAHPLLGRLADVLKGLTPDNLQTSYNSCLYYRDELHELFKRGQVSLRQRALAQELVLAISQGILSRLPREEALPAEFAGLKEQLADIYYGNFSVFQSLPDHWAIGQLFPVMPIHRLTERPGHEATIADVTCDSDGRIAHFIDAEGGRTTLPLHPVTPEQDYVLGVFLVGAYQETLGDLHNLFGDTNVASVRINADGSFDITREDRGDSVADTLAYVQYDPKLLLERFRATAEQAVREGRISLAERQPILERFSASLQGYTYYEG